MKKYKAIFSHEYKTSAGWDEWTEIFEEEHESDSLDDLEHLFMWYERKWCSERPKAKYYKQTLESVPTIVLKEVSEFGDFK